MGAVCMVGTQREAGLTQVAGSTENFRLVITMRIRESALTQNFNSKSPPKLHACVDSRRDFFEISGVSRSAHAYLL